MAVHAYLSLKGAKQGDMKGSCDQEGHVGEILVHAFEHAIIRPTDAASGQATGRAVHEPFKIVKIFDRSSPLLYNSLSMGEELQGKLKWYRIGRSGMEEHYFTIELQSAVVSGMAPYMKMSLDPAYKHYEHMEQVSFTYQAITWTWEPDGVMATMDWKKPK
jgi:type VI secretion system secreted protein Hcp